MEIRLDRHRALAHYLFEEPSVHPAARAGMSITSVGRAFKMKGSPFSTTG
jgi:hypothetical protein